MKKKRLKFKCWNKKCERTYSVFLELEGKPKLNVECPFCEKEGIADLDPYKKDIKEVFKDDLAGHESKSISLNLPDVIPTKQPVD